ncbi:MAG: ECF transporter S component [Clostridiales bacterium]|nr:ECF transporter S component [Clostridiales bacterium]
MKKDSKLFKTVATAMFTAMIFVLTRFVCVPVAAGYVHFGDALIYIVSSVLGPWGIFAAAVGEGLADIVSGWISYAPATIIVKTLISLPFVLTYKRSEKILTPLSVFLTIPAGLITVGGYYVADLIIDEAYAVVNILGNVIQAVGSAVVFVVLAGAFDAAKLKKRLF